MVRAVFSALFLCMVSLPCLASESTTDAGLSEVRQLGRLNGEALACSQAESSARIKKIMIQYAPKTRALGAAFEDATNQAFLEHTSTQAPCQDKLQLAQQIEDVANRLQASFPDLR